MEELEDTKSITIDQLLDNVNYFELNNGNYIPTDFTLKFVNFIKLVNGGEGESNTTPVVHMKMLDKIQSDNPFIANLCARGMSKTTLMFEYLVLYIAVFGELDGFGKVDAMMYVSDSMDNGVKSARKNIEFRYNNSEFLLKFLPREGVKFTDSFLEFKNKDGHRFGVRMFGAKTGIRGNKIYGKRPQIAVLDDLVSDEDAVSKAAMKTIENTVYNGVFHALDPTRRKIIFNGTPFNKADILYKAVESGAWDANVWPICERFPCTKEEFNGAWEDRFTYDSLMEAYNLAKKNGKAAAFRQELLLRISSDEERLVPDSVIEGFWYSRNTLLNRRNSYNYYITTDFATTDKQSSDYSVISVWAYSSSKVWYWVDGIVEKQNMSKNLDDLFRLASKYKIQGAGIETSGQQAGFINWIEEKMEERNIWFMLTSNRGNTSKGISNTVNKLARFNQVLPQILAGKVKFPKELKEDKRIKEFIAEFELVTFEGIKSKNDDCLDTVSMLPEMNPWQPSEEINDSDLFSEANAAKDAIDIYNRSFPTPQEQSDLSSYVV